jgi:hypothetical protein
MYRCVLYVLYVLYEVSTGVYLPPVQFSIKGMSRKLPKSLQEVTMGSDSSRSDHGFGQRSDARLVVQYTYQYGTARPDLSIEHSIRTIIVAEINGEISKIDYSDSNESPKHKQKAHAVQ